MQKKTIIYCHIYRWMRLHERVQPYVVQAGFLYISCLDDFKLDQGLIHALIKR
jgi:hypothetical protein